MHTNIINPPKITKRTHPNKHTTGQDAAVVGLARRYLLVASPVLLLEGAAYMVERFLAAQVKVLCVWFSSSGVFWLFVLFMCVVD